jgi:hypothetical protein
VVDVQQAPQFVSRHNLMFTPAIVLGGRDRIKGRTAQAMLAELVHIAAGRGEMVKLAQRLEEVGQTMTDASICGLGQTASMAVLSALHRNPALLSAPATVKGGA